MLLSPRNIFRHARYLGTISPGYTLRILLALFAGLLGSALRVPESVRYRSRLNASAISPPPIFIIGHWRSGTTHLHNLLSQDRQFSFVSMYQAVAPGCTLIGGVALKGFLQFFLPPSRPMDNVNWSMDSPQEDELPIGKLGGPSLYSMWYFPHNSIEIAKRTISFEGEREKSQSDFLKCYQKILRTAIYTGSGRRLLLKNPANTGRVSLLLGAFPGAKFIHIHRSPYDVYSSTLHLHREARKIATLQALEGLDEREIVLSIYELVMHSFLNSRAAIPNGDYVEVRYEDLERDPVTVIRDIYRKLSISGFSLLENDLRSYVSSLGEYKKNDLRLSIDDVRAVNERLGFAFEALGYPMIDS